MDVLLDDIVAGSPDEAPPVADLVFEGVFRAFFAVGPGADVAAVVPVALAGEQFADFAVLHALDEILIAVVVAALVAANHAKPLLGGLVGELVHSAALDNVDCAGLFEERMLARRHYLFIVGSTENRRGGLYHDINVFGENLVYIVPSGELLDFRRIDDFRRLGFPDGFFGKVVDFVGGFVEFFGEEVAESHDFDVGVGGNHVARRARTAPAAAYERHLYPVAALYLGEPKTRQSCRSRAEDGAVFNKTSSVHI